jgi:uncharacterized protein YyaL (SSP411 family)
VLTIRPVTFLSGFYKKYARERKVNSKRPNKLIGEKSPYLLQHAYNPVDWHPWGDEAFRQAKRKNKPIFLSIGYSTCHWCHVMEKESFEDQEVAGLMNEVFVCIKVDREERPDIDSAYMAVCQMMTRSGGWPLTIIMTPEKKPFFAATYIPKESRFGRTGMKELIPRIKELWRWRKDEALDSAEKVAALLEKASVEVHGEELGESAIQKAFTQLSRNFDARYGGFSNAPKFPTPHNLMFLLRYWRRTGDEMAIRMVDITLQHMRRGGLYDHVGFGFHRYSTDGQWLVPHFEKMLYDQALLAMAYTEAYQAKGMNKQYERITREIFTYVLREMTDPGGGFYSAEDADSEGEEGRFYLWSEKEIREALSEEEAELATEVFNIKKAGNFREEATGVETGKNILHLKRPLSEIAIEIGIPLEKLEERFETVREKLRAKRNKRVRPHKDDKVLTDWNGIMIAALAKGAQAFNEPTYEEAARRSAEFILTKMCDSRGRPYHRYRDNEAAIPAFLDDYALLVWGLIEFYETTFESIYLEKAIDLNTFLLKHFWDSEKGGFYFSSDDTDTILIRKKEIYDGAVPSGNSIAALNLLRLARLTGDSEYEDKASHIIRTFSHVIFETPAAYTMLMVALDFALGPSSEVVIVGKPRSSDTEELLEALRRSFIPNKVVMFQSEEEGDHDISRLAGFTKDLHTIEGKATVYVCKDFHCDFPTTDSQQMLTLLNEHVPLASGVKDPEITPVK